MAVNVYEFAAKPGETRSKYYRRALSELDITFNSEPSIGADRGRGEISVDGTVANATFLREQDDGTQPTPIAPLEFLQRLTDDELSGLDNATAPKVIRAKMALMAANEIVPGDNTSTNLMNAVVSAGLLTQERADEVLNGG